MVIDVWAQHPTERFLAESFFASLKQWTGQSFTGISPELTHQAFSSVDKALLSAWVGPQGALISNDEVADMINRYPDKFLGLASVDLRNPVSAVKELRTCVQERGFVGLRVVQWLWEMPCTHALYYPLLAACVELNVPICLQVGLTGPLCTSETGRPLLIERIALDFPELKILCGHIGYPWHVEMIALATKFPNVYIDTSAYLPKRYPQELVHYLQHHGQDKVLFGTNYPMLLPDACLAGVDALGLSPEIKAKFLSENAKGLFRI